MKCTSQLFDIHRAGVEQANETTMDRKYTLDVPNALVSCLRDP